MPFLGAAGDASVCAVAGVAGVGACFRPPGFFSAAAVRSEGSGAGAVCAAFESGVGEVSSGKAVLHIRSLETKKLSLAGRSSQAYNPFGLFVHAQQSAALLRRRYGAGIVAAEEPVAKAGNDAVTPITPTPWQQSQSP